MSVTEQRSPTADGAQKKGHMGLGTTPPSLHQKARNVTDTGKAVTFQSSNGGGGGALG